MFFKSKEHLESKYFLKSENTLKNNFEKHRYNRDTNMVFCLGNGLAVIGNAMSLLFIHPINKYIIIPYTIISTVECITYYWKSMSSQTNLDTITSIIKERKTKGIYYIDTNNSTKMINQGMEFDNII